MADTGATDIVTRETYPFSNKSKADRDVDKIKVQQSKQQNILNSYRSITYHFTLAGLQSDHLSDPTLYRTSELDLIILKSGGKGNSKLKNLSNLNSLAVPGYFVGKSAEEAQNRLNLLSQEMNLLIQNRFPGFEKELNTLKNMEESIKGFNTNSPGQFDMFIENIEIDTLMAFSPDAGSTLPTQIKFDVIEPYSVNGFIEALHFAAIAAGYPSYLQASFLLKMEFWGYPDNGDFSEPEKIPKSERYFPFGLTAVDVDITERGTRYKVSGVPFNERAFGEPNVIKKPIKMEGSTVGEILNNLILNVNAQAKMSDKDGKLKSLGNNHNVYAIKFPKWSDSTGWNNKNAAGDNGGHMNYTVNPVTKELQLIRDPKGTGGNMSGRPPMTAAAIAVAQTGENDIAKAKLVEILKDNALYCMADPGEDRCKATAYKTNGTTQPTAAQQSKEPEAIKYTPGVTVVQFAEKMNIHEAISSVIRDSEYSRNIIKNVKTNIDKYGMIEYFMVRMEVENLKIFDKTSKRPFQKFTYVVTPYKVHYTCIPTYGQEDIDDANLTKLSLREYNYIYTGKNIDVLNFKLNFNTLFFEAVPAAMGNDDTPSTKTGAGANNSNDIKQSGKSTRDGTNQQIPTPPTKVEPADTQSTGGNAGQPLNDPYSILAKNMHDAVINSKASMITGEIEILGDPFYLVTGGQGNYNPIPDNRGITTDGEADYISGQVLVTINFQNPVDIDPDTGMMKFDPKRVPFSGIYQITKSSASFKEGVFKQRLEILRMPGQILDQSISVSDPSDRIITVPNRTSQVIPDTTRSSNPSQRLDSSTAMEQLNRGLPSSGLPGELSNFTAASGGLGGSTNVILMQKPGEDNMARAGALAATLPSNFLSNLRLNSSGLANTGLISAEVATNITNRSLTNALKKSNIGSGIGEGATVKLPNVVVNPTASDIKFGSTIKPTLLESGLVSRIVGSAKELAGSAKELGVSAIGIINKIGTTISPVASDHYSYPTIGNKILDEARDIGNNIRDLFVDEEALYDKYLKETGGTRPNNSGESHPWNFKKTPEQSSNLSPLGYKSKILNEISNFEKNIPEGVNLSQAANSGVVLDYIPFSKIKNIPPTTPYSVAPAPGVDINYVKAVVAKGGATALANLYGVNNVKGISENLLPAGVAASVLANIPTSQINPFSNVPGQFNAVDATVIKDKFSSANSQLFGLTGSIPIVDKNLLGSVSSKYGSSASVSPLNNLVNNLSDPNAPPYTGSDPIVRERLGLPAISLKS